MRLGNKVLDIFFTIQPLAYAMLAQFCLFCNQIGALKVESDSVPRTPDPLYTHRYVKVPMRLLWQYTSTDYTVHDSVIQEH